MGQGLQREIEDPSLGPIFVVWAVATGAEEAIVLFCAVEGDADDSGGAGTAIMRGGGDLNWRGGSLSSKVVVEVAAGGGRPQLTGSEEVWLVRGEVRTAGD